MNPKSDLGDNPEPSQPLFSSTTALHSIDRNYVRAESHPSTPPPCLSFPKQKTKQKTSAKQHRAFHTCWTKQSIIVSHSISIFSLPPSGSLKRSCLREGREQRSPSPTHSKSYIPILKLLAFYQPLSKASNRKSLPLQTFHFLAAEIESSSSSRVKICHCCEKRQRQRHGSFHLIREFSFDWHSICPPKHKSVCESHQCS